MITLLRHKYKFSVIFTSYHFHIGLFPIFRHTFTFESTPLLKGIAVYAHSRNGCLDRLRYNSANVGKYMKITTILLKLMVLPWWKDLLKNTEPTLQYKKKTLNVFYHKTLFTMHILIIKTFWIFTTCHMFFWMVYTC